MFSILNSEQNCNSKRTVEIQQKENRTKMKKEKKKRKKEKAK
jgi:hypothetical protein